MKEIDILLLARPDHSLEIYKALDRQNALSYHFISFRIFKRWMSLFRIPRVSYVNNHVSILFKLTIRHILKYNFGIFKGLNEKSYFEKGTKHIISKYTPKIIHYWPSYCYNLIQNYKSNSPEVITIAEQYMPNPIYVLKIMKPVYEKYGLKFNNKYLESYSQLIHHHLVGADYVAVPSKFVEDTFKISFPNLKYLRTSYGITIASNYVYTIKTTPINKFVYVGGISLEKGVDIILEYFTKHPQFELHLFGSLNKYQTVIFSKYLNYNNIHFYGAVSKDILQEHFKKMDVGIHPSRFDAYSLAVGEEIGSGLPVIVSDHTGNKDDVTNNNWGVVYETENMSSLNNAINQIINLDNYNEFKRSIDSFINSPSYIGYGNKVISLYKQLLNK